MPEMRYCGKDARKVNQRVVQNVNAQSLHTFLEEENVTSQCKLDSNCNSWVTERCSKTYFRKSWQMLGFSRVAEK